MANGTVIRYEGVRGIVWRIQYRDGSGKQVKETVGAERDGVTEKRARQLLADRLSDVRRKAYRRPQPLTFKTYTERWFEESKLRRAWKPRTLLAYRTALGHLNGYFGPLRLAAIRPRDVASYTREALETFAPKTVQLHLNLLHDVFKTARAEELVESNPVDGAERPKVKRRRWRILEPVEVARVQKAFADEQARVIFLTLMLTGIRRFELQALRWFDVDLVESVLRVRESKSEEGERLIALSSALAEALWQHRRRSAFQGEDELVFCHPKRGSKIDHEWYAGEFRAALKAAGISDYVRPFHDARHASLTNGAAAGESPIALMSRAGHRSMQTTNVYLHLAGTVFRDEAAALEQRLLGGAKLHQTEPTSDDLSAPESPEQAGSAP
jgi:integrase